MQIQAIREECRKNNVDSVEVHKMTDCMCRGCYAGSGASLHYIPKDPETRQKWIDFIYKNRTAPKLKNLDRIRICSAHFTEECFTNYRQKMMGFGKRLILKPNAVPTIALQPEFTAPSRTRQEKLEEPTAESRLCPLCQRCQKDSNALSLHLTKKHSVHPACLDNLLISAPYADRSSGREFSEQNINGSSQHSSENTKFLLTAFQPGSFSQDNDACDESGVGKRESSYGDAEALAKDDKSSDKSNAADGNVNHHFKCHTCLEFFTHKKALSVHYNSATHIQKMTTGAGNDCDSASHILAYPYVSTKPYQCDVCHVSYFYAFGLESHLKSVLHQSRTRKAENAATNSKPNTDTGTVVANLAGTTEANTTQLASAKTCYCATQAEKVQLQPASSLLPTSVMSTQAVSTVVPLLTLSPNSVPHAIVPSVFPPPGTSTTQLIPQHQMLMPLILNGVQTQSATPDGPKQILQQAVPVFGFCPAQQVQGLVLSDTQNQSTAGISGASRIPSEMNKTVDGVGVKVKTEIKEEPFDQEISRVTPCTADAITQVDLKQEMDGMEGSTVSTDKRKRKAKGTRTGKKFKRRHSHGKKISTTKSSHVNKSSPAECNPSHAKLDLMPSSTKTCTSLSSGSLILTEFQSQVLWAFFESQNEAHSEIPPGEDCEALGKEVGLTEAEVRKWLFDTHRTKARNRPDLQSHYERQGSTEDDEDALMIDESGGMVLRSTTEFLSDEEDADDE